ncbi:MAG: FAD-dependent monooxygenase [Alphaproteobacteria bacterium]
MDTMGSSEERLNADVLIVVGDGVDRIDGIAGRVLGCALSSTGLRVALVEEAPSDNTDDGVMTVTSANRPMLETLGLWEPLSERAVPIQALRILERNSRQVLEYEAQDLGFEPFGWTLSTRHFREVLTSALRTGEAQVLEGALRNLSFDDDTVQGSLSDGRELTARLVVADDGALSPIRGMAGVDSTLWDSGQTRIRCLVTHTESQDGYAYQQFLPGGPFVILPRTDLQSWIFWTDRHPRARALMALKDEDYLAELSVRLDGVFGTLTEIGPRVATPVTSRFAGAHATRRLALVGSSAMQTHEGLGLGCDHAFRDAAALAEVVTETFHMGLDIGDAAALSRYQRWRRPDAFTGLVATEVITRLFSNDFLPLRLGRGFGLAVMARLGPLKKALLQQATTPGGTAPRLLRGEAL